MGKFSCHTCKVELRDHRSWESHLTGKKHQQNQFQADLSRKRLENGLYIKGYPGTAKSEDIQHFLSRYGKVTDFYHDCRKQFVLVTYEDKKMAERVLSLNLYHGGKKLIVKRRRPQDHSKTESENQKLSAKKPEDYSLPGVDHDRVHTLLSSGGNLEELLQELEASAEEKAKYQKVCGDLEMAFRTRFSHCKAHPFGSTTTGLNMKGSDIDVFLDMGPESPMPPDRMVRAGQRLLQQHPSHHFRCVHAIAHAKTPIIKFVHGPTRICCDVSFRNSLGVANSQLIRLYMSLDERVYPYLMIIKYWARKHEFSGCGKISNYALVTLAVFYLQQLKPPVLPSVLQLQKLSKDEKQVDGWLCSFCSDATAVQPSANTSSLFDLLGGFFSFYKDFRMDELAVCPLLGVSVPKLHFLQPELLEEPLCSRYTSRPNPAIHLRIASDLCVQDPFELSHNLTASTAGKALRSFLAFTELAVSLVQETPPGTLLLDRLFTCKAAAAQTGPQRSLLVTNTRMELDLTAEPLAALTYLLTDECKDPAMLPTLWITSVQAVLLRILANVMKLQVKEETQTVGAATKVQKLATPSDVHQPALSVLACNGTLRIWEGRRRVSKTITPPPGVNCLQFEELVSDVVQEGADPQNSKKTLLSFKCEIKPELDPLHLHLTFLDAGSEDRMFFDFMCYLNSRVPALIEKYFRFLKNQKRNSISIPESISNPPVSTEAVPTVKAESPPPTTLA